MAKVHLLSSEGVGVHSSVVHFLAPTGNNAVGTAWKAVLLEAGQLGQTAQASTDGAEAASILAGNIAEVPFRLLMNPTTTTGAARTAAIDAEAEKVKEAWLRQVQLRYNYRGYSQGTVS